MRRLAELLREVPHRLIAGPADAPVREVVYDSRRARPGSLFVAIPGLKVDGARYVAAALTTPAAPEVQHALAGMARAGARWGVLEVSSHALTLERVAGCTFDVAVMTNVTPEHLDFHGSFDEYRRAKARLFELLGQPTGKDVPRFG